MCKVNGKRKFSEKEMEDIFFLKAMAQFQLIYVMQRS